MSDPVGECSSHRRRSTPPRHHRHGRSRPWTRAWTRRPFRIRVLRPGRHAVIDNERREHRLGRGAIIWDRDGRWQKPEFLLEGSRTTERIGQDARLAPALEDLFSGAHPNAVDELLHGLAVRDSAPRCCAANGTGTRKRLVGG